MIPIAITLGAVYGGDNVIIIGNDVIRGGKLSSKSRLICIIFAAKDHQSYWQILEVTVIEMVSSSPREKTGVVFLFDGRLLAPFQMPTI